MPPSAPATRHLLLVDDLTFGYGADRLFEHVAFSLSANDRVALVAPNGAGKSTLLRLLAGELAPDGGRVVRRKDTTLGYYRQSHELDLAAEGLDVMDAFLSGFEEVIALRHRLASAREALAHVSAGPEADVALATLSRLEDEMHLAQGDDVERKVEMLAHKLGFGASDLARPVTSLSGGERGRLLLGTVLAREPDLLLLDEPTNHLDLETIDWLEGHLRGLRSAILLVSHDRRFLDRVTTATCELGRSSFRTYPVAYGQYVIERAEELERERSLVERQQAFIDKTQDFIRKNIAGQKTKQAQSRRKMLDKLDKLERPEDVWAEAQKLRVRFADAPRSGDIVLEATGLGAERGGRVLFSGLDLLVRRGDRVGIVGPNGAGKSTLLKLLAGRGDPNDRGNVRRGSNLAPGYFDQHLGELDPGRTPVEEVRQIRGDLNVEAARQYLARFRITGDDALRVIGGFSGGERSRLALAKLLLEPRNLLFLDEPTNHLDIPACEILEEALSEGYDGTLLLVSHDRQFLETVTTRLVVIGEGRAEVLPGGYAEYAGRRERDGQTAKQPKESREPKEAKARPAVDLEPAKDGKSEFAARRAALRDLERKQRRVAELEVAIAAAEEGLARMRAELAEDPKGDWASLAERAEQERSASRALDAMLEEWSRLSVEIAGS